VTSHALWVVQQLREAWAYQQTHRFLLFDRDAKFDTDVVSAVRDMGSEPTRTAFGCPWQNGVAERWVGSCRRDLLDHVIILNEQHLKRLLSSCSTTMKTGLILDWRRTRQQAVQQKFVLRVKARFNPFRDSAGCTIVMRWQRRLNSFLATQPRHGSCFPRASLTGRRFTAIPNRRAYANEKEILLTWCTTIWRTTTTLPGRRG
jgi:transposase InsO family protein